jgi:hypothetical protein
LLGGLPPKTPLVREGGIGMARKRARQFITRLTDEEYFQLLKKLDEAKLKKNEYGLKCLLDKKITVIDGFKELANEVKRVGVNVNQIARALNFGNVYDCKEELNEMQKELKEVWQSLNDFLRKVK